MTWQPRDVDALEGKTCVVTGGASGLGLAMAHRFAAAGMQVALLDVEQAALDQAVAQFDGEVLGVHCDVRLADDVAGARDRVLERFGAAHVVCLNAGVGAMIPVLETSLETWRWTVDVNLMGVVHGLHAFGPGLVDQGDGHLVLTASVAGLISAPGLGAYSATKHAVVGMAATLRDELAETGVGVSVLCPGLVKTRIFESERNRPDEYGDETHGDPAMVEAFRSMLAAGASPESVAEMVHDAVVANRLFILPSPDMDPAVQRRVDEVTAAMRR